MTYNLSYNNSFHLIFRERFWKLSSWKPEKWLLTTHSFVHQWPLMHLDDLKQREVFLLIWLRCFVPLQPLCSSLESCCVWHAVHGCLIPCSPPLPSSCPQTEKSPSISFVSRSSFLHFYLAQNSILAQSLLLNALYALWDAIGTASLCTYIFDLNNNASRCI